MISTAWPALLAALYTLSPVSTLDAGTAPSTAPIALASPNGSPLDSVVGEIDGHGSAVDAPVAAPKGMTYTVITSPYVDPRTLDRNAIGVGIDPNKMDHMAFGVGMDPNKIDHMAFGVVDKPQARYGALPPGRYFAPQPPAAPDPLGSLLPPPTR